MGTSWCRFTLSIFACSVWMFFACQANAQTDKLKWGYIDKSGKLSIQADYLSAGDFQDGLAPVMVNDKTN